MNAAMLLTLTLCRAAPAGSETNQPAIEIKPAAIHLNAPPAAAVRRSCVLRRADLKPMKILSATASDPAISVTWREHPPAGTHVVTATLPAGHACSAQTPLQMNAEGDIPTCQTKLASHVVRKRPT